TRSLRKPAFANLINAVLRRWLRERSARNATLDRDQATRSAHPPWLIEALSAGWPARTETILDANNAEAPLWLRINRRRMRRTEFARQLEGASIACRAPDDAADALVLNRSIDVTTLPGYAAGWFSVQDGAAQRAAALLNLSDGQYVLDA